MKKLKMERCRQKYNYPNQVNFLDLIIFFVLKEFFLILGLFLRFFSRSSSCFSNSSINCSSRLSRSSSRFFGCFSSSSSCFWRSSSCFSSSVRCFSRSSNCLISSSRCFSILSSCSSFHLAVSQVLPASRGLSRRGDGVGRLGPTHRLHH